MITITLHHKKRGEIREVQKNKKKNKKKIMQYLQKIIT